MEIEGRLLLFDVVHPDGSICPSDCKIDIPEKVPILDEFNNYKYLGYATVSKDEKGLIFTGEVNDDDFITEFYSGCGGYYIHVTSEPTGRLFLNSKRKITCAACGSSNVKGYYDYIKRAWIISCPDCGVFMERPDVSEKTELENEVDILNSYEKLRYQVNKSKEV